MPHQPLASIERLLREAGSLRALARRLVAPSDVDDVLQDSWVAFLQRPPEPSRPSLPWLRSIVRNLASNRRRDDRRRQVHEAGCATATASVDTAALAQTAELHRRLAVAVEGLAEPLRAVIVLCYLQGLDSSEAGRRLGLPASTVRTRHQRALEELRAALDEQSPGGRAAWVAGVHALFGAPASRLAVGAGLGVAASAIAVAAVIALVVIGSDLGSGASGEVARALPSDGPARRDAGATASPAGASAAAGAPERVEQPPRAAAAPATAATGSIEGQLLVDGQLPAFDLHLRLVARDDARALAATAGSSDLRPRLQALREQTVSSTEQGRFRFEGLPPEWPCELFVEGCEALDGAPSVSLRCPSTAVIVHLRHGPRLTGAIAVPDGGPLDLAGQCELRTLDADGVVAGFEVVPFRCRADGAFAVQLRPHGERVAATIRFEVDGRGYLHHEVPPCDRRRGADLGVLALEPVQEVELLVVDDRGLALRDATVAVDGATAAARRVGADENGVCRIGFVPRRAAALRVVAPGHAPAVVASGVARIELAPAVELAVRVDAALLPFTSHVHLISHASVFVAGASAVPGGKLAAGTGGSSTEAATGSAGEPRVWSFTPSADGTLVVADLRPGIHLAVVAVDGDGRELARCAHVLPDRGRTELVLSPR